MGVQDGGGGDEAADQQYEMLISKLVHLSELHRSGPAEFGVLETLLVYVRTRERDDCLRFYCYLLARIRHCLLGAAAVFECRGCISVSVCSVSVSVAVSVAGSVSVSVADCVSVSVSVADSVSVSLCLCVCLSVCTCVFLSQCPSVSPSVSPCINCCSGFRV